MSIEQEQRDEFGNLKCPYPGCKTVIQALTGLQELQKMRQHFNRKHRKKLTLEEALNVRHFSGG